MYDKNISKRVAHTKSKIVCYEGKETTCREIAKEKKIHIATAQRWCKRGYDTDGNPCFYKNEPVIPKKKKLVVKQYILMIVIFLHCAREPTI